MRHGNGMSSWWKQERTDHMPTKHVWDQNIHDDLKVNPYDQYFLQYIFLYIKIDNAMIDEWRIKFFECLGGKSHVRCPCCNFPLIASNRSITLNKECNWKDVNESNGAIICSRKETYICSNIGCNTRVCSRCY